MTERKFYKTTIQVEVLSEEPFEWDDLNSIHYSITDGGCSGKIADKGTKTLNGKQVAKALSEQGSDPGFFRLDEKGNDVK